MSCAYCGSPEHSRSRCPWARNRHNGGSATLSLVLAVAWAGSAAAAGWWAYGAGRDAEVARQAERASAVQEAREAFRQDVATAISKIEVRHVTLQQRTEREIVDRGVQWRDRDCTVSADWLRDFNAAIPGAEARSAASGELPASSAAR